MVGLLVDLICHVPLLTGLPEAQEVEINYEVPDPLDYPVLVLHPLELEYLLAGLRVLGDLPRDVVHHEEHELARVVLDHVRVGRHLIEKFDDGQKGVLIVDGVVELDVELDGHDVAVGLLQEHCHPNPLRLLLVQQQYHVQLYQVRHLQVYRLYHVVQ